MTRVSILLVAATFSAVLPNDSHADCRVRRARRVQFTLAHQYADAKFAVPFAVPVAVPVAVVSPYLYSYRQFDATYAPPVPEPATMRSLPAQDAQSSEAASLVQQHCASCHVGTSPSGGLSLDRATRLSPADRLDAIRAVLDGRMPKGSKLDEAERHAIVRDLLAN